MNKRDKKIYNDFLVSFKDYWDKNSYARTEYDENLEYYRGYIDTTTYPLVYNTSFNRILPIVYTILARFMEQLYQTGNIISVKPRKRRDIERVKSVEGVLNYQMECLNKIDSQGGSYATMLKWFFNTLSFGKGIAKCYWRKEERIGPKRLELPVPSFDRFGNFQGYDTIDTITEEMQTLYDGPYVEILHNKLFVPHPEYKDIQQMPRCFIIYRRNIDHVKRLADKGVYKNIKELGLHSTGYTTGHSSDYAEGVLKSLSMEGAVTTDDPESKYLTPDIDILECYGKAILEDAPYEVGSGIKIKGKEEEVICHIGNYRTILSLQRNQYGIRPLFDMGCYHYPELYWDLGMIQLTKGIQDHTNDMANLRIQNAMMMINPMLKVNMYSDIDPESLVWKPFGLVGVEDMQDVEPLVIPDTNSNLFQEQEMFYKNAIQDIMGMYDYGMGQTPQRQERVGTIYGIQAMGEARAKLLLMSMDYLGIRPLLRYMMLLNTYHLPSGFEYRISEADQTQFGNIFGSDLHIDYDFAARYTAMEPPLGKQARGERLVQLAGMWKDNPWINQYQWNKTLMELLDIREADYLLKQPQQFMQEMQAQQQAMMMAEQQKQQWEDQGKIAKSVVDSEGRMAVTERKGQFDVAVAAIQAEAAKENKESQTNMSKAN